ncbi:MAG: putative lipoprotein [Solirubrobacterales bacterium]|nr:putative lipoprotein [Solirubrobacterales bacterium]
MTSLRISRKAKRGGACALFAATLAVTGCGSSDSSSTGASSSNTGAKSSAAIDTAALGAPKKATGAPVKIGLISAEGGQSVNYPESGTAAKAAAKYANDYLGGIGGHAVEISFCKEDSTPASARACALQMTRDKVAGVVYPVGTSGGTIASIVTKAGLPYVTVSPSSAPELTMPRAHSINGGFFSYLGAWPLYAKQQGGDSYSLLFQGAPDVVAATKPIAEARAKAAGVKVTLVGVAPGTPDATPQVTAALQGDPKGVATAFDTNTCISVIRAFARAGSKAELWNSAQCVTKAVQDGTGQKVIDDSLSFDVADPEDKTYQAVMAKYGATAEGFPMFGYEAMLALITGANAGGIGADVTPATVEKAISSAKDVPFPSIKGATFTCDGKQMAGMPSVCGDTMMIADIENGKPTNFRVFMNKGQAVK